MSTALDATVRISALEHDEQNELDGLLRKLDEKKPRNLVRAAYYDGKNAARDLGISTPPGVRRMGIVLGWPAKAVDILNRRCHLDGFVIPGGSAESLGIPELWDENNLDIEAPQAGVSSLIHSCAFLIATLGDVRSGEPSVVVTTKDALSGTGMWDPRRRALRSFLSIIERDDDGQPSEMVLYLPSGNVSMLKVTGGWRVERREHSLGRVPVEPLVYQARLGRAMGSSRISRPVMSLTDSAVRSVIRSEVSAEFYGAPQRYLLGADESAFQDAAGNIKSQWQAILGRVWAIDRDDEGNVPEVGQFPQMSQQPHMDQLRTWAQLFAGETAIPVSSLGISSDANPTSAESYHASREDLIQEAEGTTDGWSPAWKRTVLTSLQLRDGLDAVPREWRALRPKWRSPARASKAAAADYAVKIASVAPWMAETEMFLEWLDLDQTEIARLLADKRRAQGAQRIAGLAAAASAARDNPAVQRLTGSSGDA